MAEELGPGKFDPRKHSSVVLSINDKVPGQSKYYTRQAPLTTFVLGPTKVRPSTAPSKHRPEYPDPCSPKFMDDKGRWTLPGQHVHSVTQPLAATPGLLGSSVHLAASSIPGHPGGDINPVAAAFSYADASPVITAEDVVHHGAHSARKGGSERKLTPEERHEQAMARKAAKEEQQAVRQRQEAQLRQYYQDMERQQQMQDIQRNSPFVNTASDRKKTADHVLRPGSPGRTMPPTHLTKSYGTGAARPRPASAGPTSYGHTQLGAAYATDPTYALSQSGPYTAIRPLGQPLPTRKGNAPGGVRDMTLLGYAPGRPATAVNSSKRHNDRYYRTHRLARPRSAYPTTGNATRYAYEPYEGEGVRGNASGGVVRHTTYTQNAGAGAADGGAKGAGAGAGESPYAAAADNPFWPTPEDPCLTTSDLKRSIELGKGCVPSGPNSRLIGSRWKFIPRPTAGDVVYTDYYGPYGKEYAHYYGRAYDVNTAEFTKHRLIEDFSYQRMKASTMGISTLRNRPGLSMDTAIVHGTGEQLGKLDAQPGPHSSLHTIRAHHNINPKTEVEAW